MSRQIDIYDHKLTEEEIDYLNSRSRRADIETNNRLFGDVEPGTPASGEQIGQGPVGGQRTPEQEQEEQDARQDAAWLATFETNVAKATTMKTDDLKVALSKRQLETTGKKDEMVHRIADYETDVAHELIQRNEGDISQNG